MNTTLLNTKIERKSFKKLRTISSNHAKYITTQEFNKLTAKNFAARIKQDNLVSKTDFDNKLISFNKKLPQINQNV